MTRPGTASRTTRALAAAAVVGLAVAACAHLAAPSAGPAAQGPSSSSASSNPTPDPSTAATAQAPTPALRWSLDPAAAASTSPYPHGRVRVPAGGLPAASTRTSPDPLVVAAAALRVMYGSDTTLDTQPMDAEKRAQPWLGGGFAAAVAAAHIVAAPGAVWNAWAAHRAHFVVTLARGYDDGAPATTATAAYQQWVITQTPVGTGPGGTRWTGTPVQTVVLIQLTRTAGRWQLTRLLQED